MPHWVTDDQKKKKNQVDLSHKLLNQVNDDNFLNNIITRNETWVYSYGVETKAQFSQ